MIDIKGTRQNHSVTLGHSLVVKFLGFNYINEIGMGDCLTKTQDFAKLIRDVLSPRSARCSHIIMLIHVSVKKYL